MLYIAIHSFLGGPQEDELLFLKASQAKLGGPLVTMCLGAGMGACVCREVLRVCARLAGIKEPSQGQGTWEGVCQEGVKKAKNSQGRALSTPCCLCLCIS